MGRAVYSKAAGWESVYAGTEEECEKLLAALVTEMKVEAAAEKERLRAESRTG